MTITASPTERPGVNLTANLFPAADELTAIPVQDGELYFVQQPVLPLPHDRILAQLIAHTPWRAESIQVWGKVHLQPRLSAWYGDDGAHYSYSGIALTPLAWTPLLHSLRQMVEQLTACRFNSVLLNYYRDGQDSMGMHSDDEAELGANPAIASLSFGSPRTFILKHKTRRDLPRLSFSLGNGNLLLMAGTLQQHWLHGIHKQSSNCAPRVNLTFRQIIIGK